MGQTKCSFLPRVVFRILSGMFVKSEMPQLTGCILSCFAEVSAPGLVTELLVLTADGNSRHV